MKELTIAYDSHVPISAQLSRQLKKLILLGELKEGTRLPSSRRLADSLGIARGTASCAYKQLMEQGFLEAHCGFGTYVKRGIETKSLSERSDCLEAISERGDPLQTEKLLLKIREKMSSAVDSSHADVAGYKPLRASIALHLWNTRTIKCKLSQVFVVLNREVALDLAARVLLNGGGAVVTQPRSLQTTRQIIESNRAILFDMPADEEGLLPEAFPRDDIRIGFVYAAPSFQFSTSSVSGSTGVLRYARRLRLLRWALARGCYILEDDHGFNDHQIPVLTPAITALDEDGITLYTSSFSEDVHSDLRLSFLVVPSHLVDAFTRILSLLGVSPSIALQKTWEEFVASGLLERIGGNPSPATVLLESEACSPNLQQS